MNLKSESTLKKIEVYLNFKNYSDNSIKIYLHYCNMFLSSFGKDVYHISQSEAISWLLNYKYTSNSQQNQIISSVKFIYKFIVKCELSKFTIERPRKEKHLPKIIDQDELLFKINSITNIKHKAIISLAYSVGLRVSEIINMKVLDIDSTRMIIHINNAKGRKDRIAPLSETILEILRSYYKQYRPSIYLFEGQFKEQYTPSSCNQIVKKYLGQSYHFHLLRHSCFTHLLESGTDLRIIQTIAGHKSSKTTEIYTHVSKNLLLKVKLPI